MTRGLLLILWGWMVLWSVLSGRLDLCCDCVQPAGVQIRCLDALVQQQLGQCGA